MSREKLPSAKTLDDRLETQRLRLFEASAVVSLAQKVAYRGGSPIDGTLDQNTATHILFALQLVERELDAIAGGLDPGVILEVSPSAKEVAQQAIDQMKAQEAPL